MNNEIPIHRNADSPATEMTKRERFAMIAMQGILTNKFSRTSVAKALYENGFMPEMKDVATIISEEAVIYADALLKELEETQ